MLNVSINCARTMQVRMKNIPSKIEVKIFENSFNLKKIIVRILNSLEIGFQREKMIKNYKDWTRKIILKEIRFERL